ncbi:MAG TPA: phosphoglycerate mutase family protein [Thermoanaerobaculia bacterium]|nr:phosphoglycerate mutase family protein [Thermoanaerobaculia bacterium]
MARSRMEQFRGESRGGVILLRHGVAEERSERIEDDDRSLTADGHRKMRDNARGLAELYPSVDAIYSSPLLRALQTALWLSRSYGKQVKVHVTDVMRPEAGMRDVRRLVEEQAGRLVILVGHEPSLTSAMRHLAGLGSRGGLELKKGGCYVLRVERGVIGLDAILTPRILRAATRR